MSCSSRLFYVGRATDQIPTLPSGTFDRRALGQLVTDGVITATAHVRLS